MKTKVHRPCPICDGKSIENIKRISFDMENILPDSYYLAVCKHCGFIYANTSATARDYERYYRKHNKYSDTVTIDAEADSIYRVTSSLLKRHINKNDAILDMGCGTGGFLMNMKRNGYSNLTGCDPSPASINKLHKKSIPCIKGSIYDATDNSLQKVDAILLSGVLEHLYNPKKAIRNVSLRLKEGGKIVCFTPDVLEYCNNPAPLPYYINIEHINHFCCNTLIKLFESCGFSLLECLSTKIAFGSVKAPVLLGVFENNKSNLISYDKINKYLLGLSAKEIANRKIIDDLVASKKKVVIWGTGNLARSYLINSNLKNAQIECFVDNNAKMTGKSFCGYTVNSPNYLSTFEGSVLILSFLYYNDIKKQILKSGFSKEIIKTEENV